MDYPFIKGIRIASSKMMTVFRDGYHLHAPAEAYPHRPAETARPILTLPPIPDLHFPEFCRNPMFILKK
jgi:hypothetical protein